MLKSAPGCGTDRTKENEQEQNRSYVRVHELGFTVMNVLLLLAACYVDLHHKSSGLGNPAFHHPAAPPNNKADKGRSHSNRFG